MKTMRKTIAMMLMTTIVLGFAMILTGCGGRTGICDNCHQETTVHDYEATMFGVAQDAAFCDACTDEVKSLGVELKKK